jgi:hypothetical protein
MDIRWGDPPTPPFPLIPANAGTQAGLSAQQSLPTVSFDTKTTKQVKSTKGAPGARQPVDLGR